MFSERLVISLNVPKNVLLDRRDDNPGL